MEVSAISPNMLTSDAGTIHSLVKRVEILKVHGRAGCALVGYDDQDLPKYVIKSSQDMENNSLLRTEFAVGIRGFNKLNHSSFAKVHSGFYADPIIFEDVIMPQKALILQDTINKHKVLTSLRLRATDPEGFTEDIKQIHYTLNKLSYKMAYLVNEYARIISDIRCEMTEYKHVKEWGGISNTQQSFYVVYEYTPGVTLEKFLVDASVNDIYCVWVCLLHTLKFMHKRGLGHGDISVENIIIKPCSEGYVDYDGEKIYTKYQPVLIDYSDGDTDATDKMMDHDIDCTINAFSLSNEIKVMTSKHLTMLKSCHEIQENLNLDEPSCFILRILRIIHPTMFIPLSDGSVSVQHVDNQDTLLSADDLIKATEDIHFEVTCNHDYDTISTEITV